MPLRRLVDLLNYEERAIAAKERDAFDESGQRLFLEYVEQSYRLFLEGEARDADASLLDEQLAQQFEVSRAATHRAFCHVLHGGPPKHPGPLLDC